MFLAMKYSGNGIGTLMTLLRDIEYKKKENNYLYTMHYQDFHDFSNDIEKNSNIPIFENFANITYRGNEIREHKSLLPKINEIY